jgi:glycosyltransferase involved in cell wall biosynthesis
MQSLNRLAARLRGKPAPESTPHEILFVSHDAMRTGAPTVLLHLLRWLKANTSLSFRTLLRSGGELTRDFEAIAPALVFADHGKFSPDAEMTRFLEPPFRLIYSNTCVNGDVLEMLAGRGIPVLSHIHELEKMIRYHVGYELFDRVKARTDLYVAASGAVKDNLVQQHGIEASRIDVIHEFIEIPVLSPEMKAQRRRETRERLGLPQDAFVAGGSGTTDWRKGPDLFVQVARILRKQAADLPIHFLWVGGGGPQSTFYERRHHEYAHLQHDVARMGLTGRVHFVGEVENPLDHFCAMDVFASTSREDPFPLVCLEAGALGLPILCFAGAGGMQELVAQGCGFVVAYLDTEEMSGRILDLLRDPEARRRLGERAAERVREGHSVEVGARRVLEAANRILERQP